MKVFVELNNGDCSAYDHVLLAHIAQKTIEQSGYLDDYDGVITVSVAFVNEHEIQRVNREFRNNDHVTDVISVGDYSDDCDIQCEKSNTIFLGEIILCYNYIVTSAQQRHVEIDHEFFLVYSHGILHLLGFRHGKKMYDIQERISEEFNT